MKVHLIGAGEMGLSMGMRATEPGADASALDVVERLDQPGR
jgi:hypothetical protein